jgi:hypothetical protein
MIHVMGFAETYSILQFFVKNVQIKLFLTKNNNLKIFFKASQRPQSKMPPLLHFLRMTKPATFPTKMSSDLNFSFMLMSC